MSALAPRSKLQRRLDTIDKLQQSDTDVWVATASAVTDSVAHGCLVPLSLAWTRDLIVLALEPASRTAKNLEQTRQPRLGIGPTRDVIVLDAEVETISLAAEVDSEIATAYASQVGWDPRRESTPFVFAVLRPVRIQAWREANEISGRTLMKNGNWSV